MSNESPVLYTEECRREKASLQMQSSVVAQGNALYSEYRFNERWLASIGVQLFFSGRQSTI